VFGGFHYEYIQAEPLVVNAEKSNLNFTVEKVVYSLSGTVISGGAPVSGARFTFTNADNDMDSPWTTSLTEGADIG